MLQLLLLCLRHDAPHSHASSLTPHVHVVIHRPSCSWVCCLSHVTRAPTGTTSMCVTHDHTSYEKGLAGMTMIIPTSTPSALHPPSKRLYAKSLPVYQPMCLVPLYIWKKDHLWLIETYISGQLSALLLPGATSSDSAINTSSDTVCAFLNSWACYKLLST